MTKLAIDTVDSGQAFSRAARYYDDEQRSNMVARWSRARSLGILLRVFRSGDHVLEVGCGTGEEALYLAARGIQVLGTDSADAMIAVARAKAAACPRAAGRVDFRPMPAQRLADLLTEGEAARFDGAFSSFGPLNCEPDLGPVVSALAALVRPGGFVVLSFLNRFSAWEVVWHLARGRPRDAFRRLARRTEATVREAWPTDRVAVYYPSLAEIKRAAAPVFTVLAQIALPWALPPQYLSKVVARSPKLFTMLAWLDLRFAGRWPFYLLGDHVVLVLRRDGDA